VPVLRPIWKGHEHRRLVEPFVGGLAVALGLMPGKALLNDTNRHVVNFYRRLQSGLMLEIQAENDRELYYRHRDRFNGLLASGQADTEEAAQLFYYLNRTGYNGLCRFNNRGLYNVPFGKYAAVNYRRDFLAYKDALAVWTFSAGEFDALKLDPEDFIYADPPYDVQFTSYSPGGFGWHDQVRLAEWLARHPGPVVASNQATSRIIDL
jgi:DNA adenine methylase